MIPVTQTKLVVLNRQGEMIQRGNCLAACVASILELPIWQVPNVETLFDLQDKSYWFYVLNNWLNSKGYEYGTDDRFRVWHETYEDKLKQRNMMHDLFNEYYLVCGTSPRGSFNHVCIYQNGKMVHDPHPTREGLLTLDYFESITKIR